MRFLGIDPGTNCGWAVLDQDGNRLDSGVWSLKSKRLEGGGMRYLRAQRRVLALLDEHGPCVLAFEEVKRHAGTQAAHVYGGLVAVLQAACEARSVPYQGVGVGTVKKLATGKGNAGKQAMVDAACEQWDHVCERDDEADALWIAEALRVQLMGGE